MNKPKLSEVYYNKFKEDPKFFSSHWDVTSRCNYRCGYCTYNNRDESFYSYEHVLKIIEFYDYLYENYNLCLTLFGGEPTIYPDFLKIIERLGKSIYPLQIFTNLSRSKEFLKEMCSIRNDLKFFASFHHEFSDENTFIEKVYMLRDLGVEVYAKIMWDSQKKKEIKDIYEKVDGTKTIDMIYHPNQSFSQEDKDWYFEEHNRDKALQYVNVDDTPLSYHQVKLMLSGMANFQGYLCDAGRRNLMICSNGDVHPCLTYRKMGHKPMYNIITDKPYIEQNKIQCVEPECYSEIGIPKVKKPKMVCMVLDERCNWNCDYCDRPRINKPKKINVELLREYYPHILKAYQDVPIHISGGETALVDEQCLDYIFSFDKKLIVETNGLFFEKYFDKYYENIESVTYHCVKELDQDISYEIDDNKVSYLIVVHRLNIHQLEDFVSKYPNRKFVLQLFYQKYLGDSDFELTIKDYFYLLKRFPTLVDKKELIRRILVPKNIDDMRKRCFKEFNFLGFDFVNGRIKFCKQSHSFTDHTQLNEENFHSLINGELKSDKEVDDICKTCIEVVRYIKP